MDRAALIDKRRRKYLAQLLERYEELIEPQVSDRESNDTFKGLVRAKMNALAVDAIDVMNLSPNEEINGLAIETRDRLYPHGRPSAQGARNR
jgi:hypothetical protein